MRFGTYSEACLKRPLKNRQNKRLKVKILQNAQVEHSALLLTCIKIPFSLLFCLFLSVFFWMTA